MNDPMKKTEVTVRLEKRLIDELDKWGLEYDVMFSNALWEYLIKRQREQKEKVI